MTKNHQVAILLLLGGIVSIIAAILMPVPGFMDAEYYYSGGVRLYSGDGFSENFIWNYLDDPSTLPHPAFTYWMPLPSVFAALGMWISRSPDFFSARVLFIMIAALIPIMTYFTSLSFSNNPRLAFFSGLLATFPVFYGIHLTNTETFSLFILLGWLFINTAFYSGNTPVIKGDLKGVLLGFLSGALHLTRADGFIWLLAALTVGASWGLTSFKLSNRKYYKLVLPILGIMAGYALVMFPWYYRNWSAFGSLFPPGNSLTIWLTNFDQLYSYPASQLSIFTWLDAGWKNLLLVRWQALQVNLQTLIAVQSEIFLFPLILMGFWKYRFNNRIRFLLIMWGIIFLLMTAIFPFAGSRGGFLHSSSAFQIFFWVMASEGLGCFINFGVNNRRWNPDQAWRIFSSFLVVMSILISIFLYEQRVLGNDPNLPVWNASWDNHIRIENKLNEYGVAPGTIIMINNPPGYFAATSKPAIVIPDGNEETLLLVAEKFHAEYLVLEENHVKGLADLYNNPHNKPGLLYLGSEGHIQFYKVQAIQ